MYQVEDEPIVTTHFYVVRETVARPSVAPIVLSLFTLSLLIVLGVTTPYTQPVTRTAIRVPAVLLGIKSFNASVAIIPTGVKTYPATTAHGILTITNGSVIGQSIPAGFTVQGVVTDNAVYVPAGDATDYGAATVQAHALISGVQGNIPAYAIHQVEGSSVYIRNLLAFRGGRDSYSVNFITAYDREIALLKSHKLLTSEVTGLHYPCTEQVSGALTVTWRCKFITYRIPTSYHVAGVRIIGKNLLLHVWFVARPTRIGVK